MRSTNDVARSSASCISPAAQEDIFESVRGYLLAAGEIEPQEPDEDPAAFERRVREEVDHYMGFEV